MKKIILLTLVLLIAGASTAIAQNYVVNPIPSINYQMNEPEAVFHENKRVIPSTNKEKRDMDVVVNTRSTNSIPVFATVYVFKRNGNKILGPFYVLPGVQLSVPIDKSKWGVLVKCLTPVDVSVWTSD
jgi:hypothetical protein